MSTHNISQSSLYVKIHLVTMPRSTQMNNLLFPKQRFCFRRKIWPGYRDNNQVKSGRRVGQIESARDTTRPSVQASKASSSHNCYLSHHQNNILLKSVVEIISTFKYTNNTVYSRVGYVWNSNSN